jgi:hypothetical protein
MLCVDRCWNIVRDDGAPATGAHNGDDHVAWENGIAFQLFVFLWSNKPPLTPCELVVYSVVDAEYGDASVGKFGVQKLAAKRPSANRLRFV